MFLCRTERFKGKNVLVCKQLWFITCVEEWLLARPLLVTVGTGGSWEMGWSFDWVGDVLARPFLVTVGTGGSWEMGWHFDWVGDVLARPFLDRKSVV